MKGAAEEIDGVALDAESDVGVDGGGDADVGVAEEFLDHDEFDPLFQEEGRGRVKFPHDHGQVDTGTYGSRRKQSW